MPHHLHPCKIIVHVLLLVIPSPIGHVTEKFSILKFSTVENLLSVTDSQDSRGLPFFRKTIENPYCIKIVMELNMHWVHNVLLISVFKSILDMIHNTVDSQADSSNKNNRFEKKEVNPVKKKKWRKKVLENVLDFKEFDQISNTLVLCKPCFCPVLQFEMILSLVIGKISVWVLGKSYIVPSLIIIH